jgi:predicted P-loop ATPase
MSTPTDAWVKEDPIACPTCGRESCEDHLPPDPDDDPVDFQVGKSGRILANSFFNLRLALKKLNITLGYDAFARTEIFNGAPPDDVTIDRLWVAIDDTFHFRPSKSTLRSIITDSAYRATRHPVCEYLATRKWDGTPRIDSWLSTYGGATPCPYVDAVGALVLIALVRRVRRPGVKFDELLVLESGQGKDKSSALRALCPCEEWFSDDLPLGVDSKQVIERTRGKWILEASEMHGHRGKETEQLKAFLSRQTDGPVRLAYGRESTTVPRQFVIIGTTNTYGSYLKDSTGSRRIWPVRVDQFDIAALERDREDLWAEAAAREAAGASIRLNRDLWQAAGDEQELRRAADPWEAILEPLFISSVDTVPVQAIWDVLKLEALQLDNRAADRVASIAQRFGFEKERRRTGRYWVKAKVDGSATAANDESL